MQMSALEQEQIEMAIRASMFADAGDAAGAHSDPSPVTDSAYNELQKAIQASLASAGNPTSGVPAAAASSADTSGVPAAAASSADHTDTVEDDLQRAIQLSLAGSDATPPMPPP